MACMANFGFQQRFTNPAGDRIMGADFYWSGYYYLVDYFVDN